MTPDRGAAGADRQATLYLHIGRNKAGSTTLQDFFLSHGEALRRAGIVHALFGHQEIPGVDMPCFPSHLQLAAWVRAAPCRAVLVSNELICCLTDSHTRTMAEHLAPLDMRVIFYIRPYRDWVISSYQYDVRIGVWDGDIDAYLEQIGPRISVWPCLELWGEIIGWQRLHVRSLNPADLSGGHLIADCLAAIGLEGGAYADVPRANASPSWVVVELLRAIDRGRTQAGWTREGLAIAEALHAAADAVLNEAPDPCVYFTRAQAERLAGCYNRDLERLAARTGQTLSPDPAAVFGQRPFVPSAARIDRHVLEAVRRAGLEEDAARLHPELAEFLRRTVL